MEGNELSERDKKFVLQCELIDAAKDGDIESIKSLISKGVDIHAHDDEVLLHAAKADAVSVFEFFSSSSFGLDIFDDRIIHVVTENKSTQIAEFLIKHSAISGKKLNIKGSHKTQFFEMQTALYEKKLLDEDLKKPNI